ncbi:hypothetical protein Pfo_005201 [Paulownia fortunei]|nr:hypothetical protein Pfo_005201 [Paulownia fortunei]
MIFPISLQWRPNPLTNKKLSSLVFLTSTVDNVGLKQLQDIRKRKHRKYMVTINSVGSKQLKDITKHLEKTRSPSIVLAPSNSKTSQSIWKNIVMNHSIKTKNKIMLGQTKNSGFLFLWYFDSFFLLIFFYLLGIIILVTSSLFVW